ncbi:diguanylate cyclase [Hydrogenimonas thermophila]|uniref:diguanylate cyclase n=1 Tax=Hydrogenimonas thermophila TaxID=223786 RepID=A0A1I5M0R8_9BACT|nr:diguanylate cyclase [Hydrogenimonas thermophila]WOE70539.1 diguanylate cyclase [Hydrogenimonas thermophila]WOE73055.1 diguanylate cyclase [Hydrogenimonas thermophila]SFP03159.1 response regulator receiver modulated diguanylate cyclase [Hydrogenimonas thermophila]
MGSKTILIVDDTIANLDILVDLLGQYDVIDAVNGEDALEIANEESIDLILLDIMMPEMDGYEVCKRLKSNEKTKDIPVIFITAKTDEDSIEKAYDIGGADYVTKPFRPKELLSRVKKELKLQELMKELKLLASTDPMTKLYNRRYFTNVSQHILEIAKRENQSLSLVMLDIDKFKNINDTYGHQIGDEVIISLANELTQNQRKSDIVSRYGGEEFVVLLPNTSLEEAIGVAEKLREKIDLKTINLDNYEKLKFTISLGVSEVKVFNEKNIEKALKRADDALYTAKESGRNRVCFV